jgi:hypothetical protein
MVTGREGERKLTIGAVAELQIKPERKTNNCE